MTSISWWRSWHGAPTDHKWAVIANRAGVKVGIVSAVAWALLDYASQNDPRGSIEGFDTETYAVYSGFDEREIIAVIQAMTDKGVITNGRLTAWEKRQPQREDNSTPRVRKMREMKRNETQCNAPDKDTEEDTYTDNNDDGEAQKRPNIFAIYEGNITQLTPIVSDELIALEKDYPAGWVEDAIVEAAKHNARNLAYIKAILRNRKDGKQKPAGKPSNGNGSKLTPAQQKYQDTLAWLDKVESGEVQL